MNQPTDDKEAAKIDDTVRQSELIAALEVWQPMHTAPLDGTEILAIVHGRRVIAFWSYANVWVTNGAVVKPICWQRLPAVPVSIPLKWLL